MNLNQRGFTIVEVMIASAILMITGAATLTMIDQMRRQVRALDQKIENISIENDLLRLATDVSTCSCIFGNINMAGTADVQLANLNRGCGSSSEKLVTGATIQGGDVSFLVESGEPLS